MLGFLLKFVQTMNDGELEFRDSGGLGAIFFYSPRRGRFSG